MVLDTKTIEKIKALVYQRPRSINEIAQALSKNWRTINRYIEHIIHQTGTIKMMTFREGTRGALKVVYWNNTEKIYSTDVQEKLFRRIEQGLDKSDFSPFEIYQYVDAEKRDAYFEEVNDEKKYDYDIGALVKLFRSAEQKITIFAGNLAFIHIKYQGRKIIKELEECIGRKVIIKVITNVNFDDLDNVERVLSLNAGLKEPLIEVRHGITPLRAYIFDEKIARLGEVSRSTGKQGQTNKLLAFYYEIRENSWVNWLQNLFWKTFQSSIPAKARIENLRSIRKKG